MDNRNVFVAIALSMSVLLFWGAFFETPRKTAEQNNTQQVEQNNNKSSIAPTINQPIIIKKVTIKDSNKVTLNFNFFKFSFILRKSKYGTIREITKVLFLNSC